MIAQLPELLVRGESANYCDFKEAFLHQFKMVGSYTFPKVGVLLGVSYQNIPSNESNSLAANFVASNAIVRPSLGRALSGGSPNVTVNLVKPGTFYPDRINQLDLRLSKVFRFGARRAGVNLDIANALNASSVFVRGRSTATGCSRRTSCKRASSRSACSSISDMESESGG